MDRSRSFSVGRAWRGAPWRCAGFLGVVTAGLANFGFAQPPARNSDKSGSAAAQPEPAPLRSDSVSTTVEEANGDPSLLRGSSSCEVGGPCREWFRAMARTMSSASPRERCSFRCARAVCGEGPAGRASPPARHVARRSPCGRALRPCEVVPRKQLLSECRLELLEVLRQDATREDARRMIARLDDVLVDPADKKPALTAADAEKAVLRAKYGVSDLQSLGG